MYLRSVPPLLTSLLLPLLGLLVGYVPDLALIITPPRRIIFGAIQSQSESLKSVPNLFE